TVLAWLLISAHNKAIHDLIRDNRSLAPAVYLGSAVLLGLVLSSLNRLLYRILEGYLGWPRALSGLGHSRQIDRRQRLIDHEETLRLTRLDDLGELDESGQAKLAERRNSRRLRRLSKKFGPSRVTTWLDRIAPHSAESQEAVQRRRKDMAIARLELANALAAEKLRRYPSNVRRVAPTRLGNSIMRLEEYGHDRFRLDPQVWWYELTAVVPEEVRNQVNRARTGVDFLVCLLAGHVTVAIAALVIWEASPRANGLAPLTAACLLVLAVLWYRTAVGTVDDWASAVRAMVNLGRVPLATALGLNLPETLAQERELWEAAEKIARGAPLSPGDEAILDQHRTGAPEG
ncbi:MAG TPA: hypothetical protein VNW94_20405, partial [Streptosporangiaceae bacterium]|nr:hypothetical protein [Streptosporangiaceae bacterium]